VLLFNPSRKALELEVRQFQAEVVGHVPVLLAFGRRLCRNETEAEDLVQDTVIKAIRARKQFQPGTHMKAWLIKILRNAFINRYHRNAVERTLTSAPVTDPVVDGWMSHASVRAMRDPESFTLRPELRDALVSAIDRLPPDFKEVVLLADAEGLSYREVADVLDCPMGTVMSRLHRARRLLKADLIQHARDLGIVAEEDVHLTDESTTELTPAKASPQEPAEEGPIELEAYRTQRAAGERASRRRSR
jgi:RNA polymerase sigma-70 factor (ECF subfamily)